MISNSCKLINMIILSMASKQKILNKLNNNFFSIDIYQEYINNLIEVNLEIMDKPAAEKDYLNNIENYLQGKIDEPDEVLFSIIKEQEVKEQS
ncbi:MAG: hypothetical protein ACOCQN_01580 [Halanaerobiaceae bacterium]